MGVVFLLYVCHMEEMKIYADFLEALGIIEKWQKNAPKENKELTRLAELMLSLLDNQQNKVQEIKDLKDMNSMIRDKKNKEILTLKQMM